MAWPKTPLTTYVANSPPPILAADLNSLQTGTNGIINGTYSLQGEVIDGIGGQVVAPTVGGIKFINVSNPARASSIVNQVLSINTTKAWGCIKCVSGVFTIIDGIGFSAVARSTGPYGFGIQITLMDALDTPNPCVTVTPNMNGIGVWAYNRLDSSNFVVVAHNGSFVVLDPNTSTIEFSFDLKSRATT